MTERIGILGTGMVWRAHAAKLADLGKDVTVGTRDVAATMATTGTRNMPFKEWHAANPRVKVDTFAQAAADSDLVISALNGEVAVETLRTVEAQLRGKVLIDISNPLDFSMGMPPTLSVCNDDSLGEQIQRALPDTRVVKSLNTLNVVVQVDPNSLAGGDHHIFMSGNDAAAKEQVARSLEDWYGWTNIIDLGDITTARGPEMMMPVWLRLMASLGTPAFNFKIVR
jgi:hypothetical protein